MAQNRRNTLRQTLLMLVGVSLVYENFTILIGGRSFSYAMILLILWTLCLVNDFKSIRRTYHNYAFDINLLIIFLLLIIIMNYIYASSAIETPIFPGTLFFNTLFFILLLIDYSCHPQDLYAAFVGYAIGSMVVPILFFAGFGVEFDETERLVFFGNNSNVFGVRLSFAIGIILHLFIIQDYFRIKSAKFWFILPIVLLTSVLLATGSRTALLCLFLILGGTILSYKGQRKFIIVFGGILALVALYLFLRGTVVFDRLLYSVNTGDTGGRTDIWEALLPYCWENQWFGVGMTGYDLMASKAYGRIVNPHNVIIEIFAYSGFVGLTIYVFFWLRLVFRSIKLRNRNEYMPLVLLLPLIVNIFCGHVIETKISYLVYAYILYLYKNMRNPQTR